ncbi:MAG TPA: VIT family protein [Candidatus Saccharimonadales bacterium]|nr:VIT family protein [Candidatus Saccharimonadales bacterium]
MANADTHHNHPVPRHEGHKSHRAAWLRASVLGADDGIVSTASLMLGVAAASASKQSVLTAGIAGLIAGAMSMAAGEYVSVSSQRDSERADLRLEASELQTNPKEELHELADIYIRRGLQPELAREVATQLHKHDALAAHARDELGIDGDALARPLQAATSSAASFSLGAVLPVLAAIMWSSAASTWAIVITALVALAISGGIGAHIGGGNRWRAALRVLAGGGLAMLVTAIVGHVIGTSL